MSTSGGTEEEETICLVSSHAENGAAAGHRKSPSKKSKIKNHGSDEQTNLLRNDAVQSEDIELIPSHKSNKLLQSGDTVKMSELNDDIMQSAHAETCVIDEDGNIYVTPSSNAQAEKSEEHLELRRDDAHSADIATSNDKTRLLHRDAASKTNHDVIEPSPLDTHVVDEDGNIYVTTPSNGANHAYVTSAQSSDSVVLFNGYNGDIAHMNSLELESPDDQPCGKYEVIVAEVHNSMSVRDIVDDKMQKLIDSTPVEGVGEDALRGPSLDEATDSEVKSASLEAYGDQEDENTVITETSAVTSNERNDSLSEQDVAADAIVPMPGMMPVTGQDGVMAGVAMGDGVMSAMMMPTTMPPVYLPPGLHELYDTGQLVIHKANLRHNTVIHEEAAGRFEVIEETRRMLFYVEQAVPEHPKTFLFKIYNRDKQEVASVINPLSRTCIMCNASWHCLPLCHFQAMVFAPPGQVAGFIRRSRTCFLQEFEILNAQEDLLLTLRGGIYDLEVYSPDLEHELGRLSVHGWHGIMHEVRRSNEDIGITFPIDLDVQVKMVLVGAVFAIDWLYATKGGRR